LLDDNNEYIRARAVWLLAAIGGEGKTMVEQLLIAKDTITGCAYKLYVQTVPDIIPYAEKMVNDPFLLYEEKRQHRFNNIPIANKTIVAATDKKI
jgi:hypothetical protein